jgi:hypothetical protein
LKSCTTGTLSLEFSTLRKSGLLLRAKVGVQPEGFAFHDWLEIQLYNGFVRVELSLGDVEPVVLSIGGKKLNDGQWHMVELYRNATVCCASLLSSVNTVRVCFLTKRNIEVVK